MLLRLRDVLSKSDRRKAEIAGLKREAEEDARYRRRLEEGKRSLEERVRSLEQENRRMEKDKRQLGEEKQQLQKDVQYIKDELQKKDDALTEEMERSNRERQRLEEGKRQLEEDVRRHREQLDKQKKKTEEAESEKQKAEERFQRLDESFKCLATESKCALRSLKEGKTELQCQGAAMHKKNSEQTTKIQALEKSLATAYETMDNFRATRKSVLQKYSALKTAEAKGKKKILQLETEVSRQRKELKLRGDIRSVQMSIVKKIEAEQEKLKSVAQKVDKIEELTAECSRMAERNSDLEKSLENKSKHLAEVRKKAESDKKKFEEKLEKSGALWQSAVLRERRRRIGKTAGLRWKIFALDRVRSGLAAESAGLRLSLGDAERKVGKLKSDLGGAREEKDHSVALLESALGEKAAIEALAKHRADEATKELERLRREAKNANESAAAKKKIIATLQEERCKIQGELAELEEVASCQRDEIEGADLALSSVRERLRCVEVSLEEKVKEAERAREETKEVRWTVEGQKKNIRRLEAEAEESWKKIRGMEEREEETEDKIRSLGSRVDKFKRDMDELEEDVRRGKEAKKRMKDENKVRCLIVESIAAEFAKA